MRRTSGRSRTSRTRRPRTRGHLRDGADHAVDPQAGKPLLQVEARDPGLVHAPGPGVHGTDPLRDGAGVVAEGRGTYLPGHDVEGDGLYRAGVDVEADEGGSIEHGSPFHECGVAATVGLDTHHCRPNPRSFMQQGLSMFYVPLISSLPGGERARPTTSRLRAPPIHSCRNLVVC